MALGIAVVYGGAWLRHDMSQQAGPTDTGPDGYAAWMHADAVRTTPRPPDTGVEQNRTPTQLRELLVQQGVFDASTMDGSWSIERGRLHPTLALRQRFDHYLLGLDLCSEQDLRSLVKDDATRQVGATMAADILAVWDAYARLRQHTPQHPFKQNDRSTWHAHVDELRMVRRAALGPAWADAFFAQDDASFKQYLAQLSTERNDQATSVAHADTLATPPQLQGNAALAEPTAASERMAVADWDRRLADSQAELQRLQDVRELSPEQRRQAMHQHVQTHFQGDEALRVQALLDLR